MYLLSIVSIHQRLKLGLLALIQQKDHRIVLVILTLRHHPFDELHNEVRLYLLFPVVELLKIHQA